MKLADQVLNVFESDEVIGKTKSGKPVYRDSAKHPSTKDFTKQDHEDAYDLHKSHYEKLKKDREEGKEKDYSKSNHHYNQMDHHYDNAKGDIKTTDRGAKMRITRLEKGIDRLRELIYHTSIPGRDYPEKTHAEFEVRAKKEVKDMESKIRRLKQNLEKK
jgi:hypothetical protein